MRLLLICYTLSGRWQSSASLLQTLNLQDLHLRRSDIKFCPLMDDVIWCAYHTADKAHSKPAFTAHPFAEPDNPSRRSLYWMDNLPGHFAACGWLIQGEGHRHRIPEKKPHRQNGGVNGQREQG